MMLMAEATHEPSRLSVMQFAHHLIGSRPPSAPGLRERQADALAAEINAVFKSAGTSTAGFLGHIAAFENVMVAMGTQKPAARKFAQELQAIGRQVRGPEDTPIRPLATAGPR
jgi:hypothetical protein